MPSSPRPIAGVPSGWELPGFPITIHHLCVVGALAVWRPQQNIKKLKKWTWVLFYSSFVCLYVYAYDLKSKVHSASALYKWNKMKNQLMFRMYACRACCVFMDVCFLLLFFCLYICVCVCLQIQGPLLECRSIRSGASRLPYYCTPLVCVPTVIGLLAVWRHNKPKNINQKQFAYCSRPLVQPRWECNRCKVPKVLKASP